MKGHLVLIALAGIAAPVLTAAPARAADCRTVELPDGSKGLFCKDRAGKWIQQEGEIVAPETRGKAAATPGNVDASYQGTYSVGVMPRPKTNSRRLTVGNILSDATAKPQITNQGGISFKLRITGEMVTGTVQPVSLTGADLAGTKRGGICRLMSPQATYEGKCGPEGFSGKITGTLPNGRQLSGQFETAAVGFEDTSQRDNQRADLKRQCDAGSQKACVDLEQFK